LFIERTFNSFEIRLARLGAIVRGEQEMTRGGPSRVIRPPGS
jgi:hypothetical protein